MLGASDGLTSNLSLVMGVAGATLTGHAVLIAGLAGLLAGAFSMSIGEWVSVQSARELNQHQIAIERQELQEAPKEEQEELALIYQSKGLDEHAARELAANLMQQGTTALDTLAREELGIDPKDLGGSAWGAAITSFFLFALGAIIPVFPFIFTNGLVAGQIVWTPPTAQQGAHFLSTLDPLRHSPHQVAEDAQSREVCGKQQTRASETICRLANCFPSVHLENQMVQRPHEQNRVECRGRHRMEVSCVSHDTLHLSVQSRRLEPELTSFQQGR